VFSRGSGEGPLTASPTLFVPPTPFWTMLKLKTNCSEAHCGARHHGFNAVSLSLSHTGHRRLRNADCGWLINSRGQ